MDQFCNPEQISNYDATRPKYTPQIFKEIVDKTKGFNNYLDIACGTGQLLIPLSPYFKKSIGIDVSEEQIKKAIENTKGNSTISCYTLDAYDVLDTLAKNGHFGEGETKMFDLITIGQAFHWFDEEKLLSFIHEKLLTDSGLLVIAGYKKQHFKEGEKLIEPFEGFIKKLKPYFECDVDFNDSGYERTNPLFQKFFTHVEKKYFEEESEIAIQDLIKFVKSWSGYHNYIKNNQDDPATDLLNTCLTIGLTPTDKVKFFNFYFYLELKN
jgi:SAM-dependent methyltransferase